MASYAANLAGCLHAMGVDVTVFAPTDADGPATCRHGAIPVQRVYSRGPRAVPVALAAARASGARVVHLQHELFLYGGPASVPGLPWALATQRLRPRSSTVVTLHHVVDPGLIDAEFTRTHRVRVPAATARLAVAGVQHAVRRLANAVVVHEPSFQRVIPGARVIPHGVEVVAARRDPGAARKRLGLDRALTVLCFGFLAPYKGLETALAAAARTRAPVHVVIAGAVHPRLADAGDDYAARLRDRWGRHATFVGHVPEADIPDWFAAADVALHLHPQPFSASGSLALASAYRTPVLLSDGMARAVGAAATLAVPRDPAGLARRLDQLATDPASLAAVAHASRALCHGRSWPEVARRHQALYEELGSA